jgi:hypothetical protein
MPRRGGRDRLAMGVREPLVAGVPPPQAASAWGPRPFDASARLLRWLARRIADPRPSCLRRLILHWRGVSHAPSLRLHPRADCPGGTPLAVCERTRHDDPPAARRRAVFPPGH